VIVELVCADKLQVRKDNENSKQQKGVCQKRRAQNLPVKRVTIFSSWLRIKPPVSGRDDETIANANLRTRGNADATYVALE
jgi:hypothetical protein